MLTVTNSKLETLVEKNPDILANAYVYALSHEITLPGDADGNGKDQLMSLIPSKESIKAYTDGEISKKQFKKQYQRQLKHYTNQFLLYTIARSFNEKKYLPIFVCSDDEADLGYLDMFTSVLKKKFGMKVLKIKEYVKLFKAAKKEAKKAKKKKREKALSKLLRDIVRDNCQMTLDGLEYLEKQDKKFAIDRIAILINQSDNPADEIPKKAILESIQTFSKGGKKADKLVRQQIKELDLSKKSERWGKKDAIKLALAVYNELHDDEEDK